MIEPGSTDSAMRGKQYNISVRVLKIVYEVLQRLKLDAFEKWLQTTNKHPLIEFLESIAMNILIQTRNSNNFYLVQTAAEGLFDLYQESDEEVACDTGYLDTGVFSL